MKKFRIPRKIKKKLQKTLFTYKHDQGTKAFFLAFPSFDEEDFNAYIDGKLTSVDNIKTELDFKHLKENEINLDII